MTKDTNGHHWSGHRCERCGANAWTEKAMWPCVPLPVKPEVLPAWRSILRGMKF